MKHSRSHNSVLTVLCVVTLMALVYPSAITSAEESGLQAVWQRVRQSGAYHFNATLTQTLTPRPTVINAGRKTKQTSVYLEGQTDLPAELLHLTLWSEGGSVLAPETGLQVKVEGNQAYSRQGDGPWEAIEDFTGLFAPGGDFMAYLAAAENVRLLEPETQNPKLETRYTFDINGRRKPHKMRPVKVDKGWRIKVDLADWAEIAVLEG